MAEPATDPRLDEIEALFERAAATAAEQVPGTVLVTLAGSHAYGTQRPGSDLDIMGIYIAPLRDVLSLRPPPETRKLADRDATFYELRHFCKLAASCNPTVLEVLGAPVLLNTPAGQQIRDAAPAFVSKLARKTYGGYAISQIRKAEAGTGGSRGLEHYKREKFLVHTLRLLAQGRRLLSTGYVQVALDEQEVDSLRATARQGLEAVRERSTTMLAELDAAAERSSLPEGPDHAAITELICQLRGVA